MFHVWVTPDGGETEFDECIECGGVWNVPDPDDISGDYESASGERASDCPGVVGRVHGEGPCQLKRCETRYAFGPCEHMQHNCNCLYCQ